VIGGLIGEKIETRRNSIQRASGKTKIQITEFLNRKSDEKQILGADDGSTNRFLAGSPRRASIIQKNIMASSPRKLMVQNNSVSTRGGTMRGSPFGHKGTASG
jgi:hypothetical protein